LFLGTVFKNQLLFYRQKKIGLQDFFREVLREKSLASRFLKKKIITEFRIKGGGKRFGAFWRVWKRLETFGNVLETLFTFSKHGKLLKKLLKLAKLVSF